MSNASFFVGRWGEQFFHDFMKLVFDSFFDVIFVLFQNGNIFQSSLTVRLDVMDGVIEALDIAPKIR
jgi:hypothetical protein